MNMIGLRFRHLVPVRFLVNGTSAEPSPCRAKSKGVLAGPNPCQRKWKLSGPEPGRALEGRRVRCPNLGTSAVNVFVDVGVHLSASSKVGYESGDCRIHRTVEPLSPDIVPC